VEYRLKGLLYQLAAKRPRQIFCDNRLAAVTGYMKENIQKKITLAELANVASLEKSYFNRWFRQFTGKSPLKFFMQMKLQVAKELLNENMSNSYIATTLSFADEFHFCRSFKQQFGITPKAFARNNHLTSI
jgi:AraC-like DNA-binding protein